MQAKPLSILIYSNKSDCLNELIIPLRKIIQKDKYTINALSKPAFLTSNIWMDHCNCLMVENIIVNDDLIKSKFNSYFMKKNLKMFILDESFTTPTKIKLLELCKNIFGNNLEINKILINKEFDENFELIEKNKEENIGEDCQFIFKRLTDKIFYVYFVYKLNGRELLISNISINQLKEMKILFNFLGIETNDYENNKQFPKFSVGYMFTKPDTAISSLKMMNFGKEIGNNPKFIFQPSTQLDNVEKRKIWEQQVSETLLPIEIRRQKEGIPDNALCNFNIDKFYKKLETKIFGRFLIFMPICSSTMDISDSLSKAFPTIDGFLVVAGYQTAGRGRSGNQWLSPFGAAMFNINVIIPFDSIISKSLVLIQHLIAVSICQAINELIKDFPIKIKWPNDIYYKRDYKLGGILVSSFHTENGYSCSIGVGLNISNSKPTICINDLISTENNKLEIEDVIAMIMNKFEEQFESLNSNNGFNNLKSNYEKYWLHTNEQVKINLDSNGCIEEKVIIKGIDENGYLLVLKESGDYESLMDNGNRFDLLHGLIFQNRM